MPVYTARDASHLFVKAVVTRGIELLVGNLIMGALVPRDLSNAIARRGNVVNVEIPPVMTARRLTDGGAVEPQNPHTGSVPVALTEHYESSFEITDFARALEDQNVMDRYVGASVVAIAEEIEKFLLRLWAQFGLDPSGAYGEDATEGSVDEAEQRLFDAKVPQGLRRFLITSSNAYSQLRQIPRFTEDKVAQGLGIPAITEGNVGRLKGFNVLRTQYLDVTPGTPNQEHGIAFVPDAMHLVMRQMPQVLPGTGATSYQTSFGGYSMRAVMSYDKDILAQQVTVDVLFGGAVIRPEFGLEYRT